MKKIHLIFLALAVVVVLGVIYKKGSTQNNNSQIIQSPQIEKRTWQIKSADTMKYSRDLALEKLNDPTFDQTINLQIKNIADLGATHVAIATPYDEKFLPILTRWVQAARRYNLKVWFRGNFSGWEGWFGKKRSLSREEHLDLTRQFISNHAELFADGDAFSACPECENGGSGDPRGSGDVAGFRQFMISEYQACLEEFSKLAKNVVCNLASMNYDVAKLVMDQNTAGAMGGIVAIDHYVKNPQKLSGDIVDLAAKTDAKIFLGEFGAPIPDIHGRLSDEEQAAWVEEALSMISKQDDVIGINYWVSHGGSTEIFNDDGSQKPTAAILKKYFKLQSL